MYRRKKRKKAYILIPKCYLKDRERESTEGLSLKGCKLSMMTPAFSILPITTHPKMFMFGVFVYSLTLYILSTTTTTTFVYFSL